MSVLIITLAVVLDIFFLSRLLHKKPQVSTCSLHMHTRLSKYYEKIRSDQFLI